LRNEVMRMAACARGSVIAEEDRWEAMPAPGGGPAPASQPRSLKAAVAELEKRLIEEALRSTEGNQQRAARQLGLSRQGLINKMKRYGF
jgi:DNA-binding NtrC family response regulator